MDAMDRSILTVQVDEKVDKILRYLRLSGSNVNGEIMSLGKVIIKPDEQTFKKIHVTDM